jgi:hypothetical protein
MRRLDREFTRPQHEDRHANTRSISRLLCGLAITGLMWSGLTLLNPVSASASSLATASSTGVAEPTPITPVPPGPPVVGETNPHDCGFGIIVDIHIHVGGLRIYLGCGPDLPSTYPGAPPVAVSTAADLLPSPANPQVGTVGSLPFTSVPTWWLIGFGGIVLVAALACLLLLTGRRGPEANSRNTE